MPSGDEASLRPVTGDSQHFSSWGKLQTKLPESLEATIMLTRIKRAFLERLGQGPLVTLPLLKPTHFPLLRNTIFFLIE